MFRFPIMKPSFRFAYVKDHFDILASGKTDYHCKIKETLK